MLPRGGRLSFSWGRFRGVSFGVPDSLGVPEDFARLTIILPYNDLEAVRKVVEQEHRNIACIIVEPVAGNMGVVLPEEGFLEGLRKVCSEFGIVLIFDEVITGFRLAPGGAQQLLGIEADLTCLGKIIGGGFPIGAYGGKQEIMESVSPLGGVYQAGTLSGNPVATSAGLATLKLLSRGDIYKVLAEKTESLCDKISKAAEGVGIEICINRIGSMFTVFFAEAKITDLKSAKRTDASRYAKFFHGLLKEGVYLPPSNFESCFTSLSHSVGNIETTTKAAQIAFKKI